MDDAEKERLRDIFFPYMARQRRSLLARGGRLVHYTSAEVAAAIISNGQIWMRNAVTMNDFMEVQHGLNLVSTAYNGEPGKALKGIIEDTFPGLTSELEQTFNGLLGHFRTESYLTCVSEHDSDEDELGRLSMWRAYGGNAGVALVLNRDVISVDAQSLMVFSSPVLYAGQKAFDEYMLELAGSLETEQDFVRLRGRDDFKQRLFLTLWFATLSTKHPGFREEREWRVIHAPSMYPSQVLGTGVEIVRGVPQRVYKLPLRDIPEHKLSGLSIPALIERIIIGPNEQPVVTWQAFVDLLGIAGVPDPQSRVVYSDIPLRHRH